jgi:xylulokinase
LPGDGPVPPGWRASTGINGGPLFEAGLSAAGSAIGWLSELVGTSPAELIRRSSNSPPGANGVIALPWLNGARAPWWRSQARATFLGVTSATSAGDLARALYEGVAHDIRRCLGALAERPRSLWLTGGGATEPVWQQVVSGITALPFDDDKAVDAAAIGAARLAMVSPPGVATHDTPPDRATGSHQPDPEMVASYFELSKQHDAAAEAVIGSLG